MIPRTRLLPLIVAFALSGLSSHAAVVINEIMYHPSSHLVTDEWIELYNTDVVGVDLTNWKFTKGVDFTFPAGTTIPAGGYLVVAANGPAFTVKYPTVTNYRAGWLGQLSNSANHLTLKDNNGTVQDEVEYADDGDWAVRTRDSLADAGHRGWFWKCDADGLGKSLELIRAGSDNNVGQNWKASTTVQGTPGVVNSVVAADVAPFILEVQHFPLVPKSTDAVTVTARILDELATGITATLFYREDGVAGWTSTALLDDGAHGDGVAGDKIFGAQIAAKANGKIVEFYVQASDSGARVRLWPLAVSNTVDPSVSLTCNCLYQVDNTTYSGAAPLYRLVIKSADRAELTAINDAASLTDNDSHAKFNTTFITVDGSSTELRYLCSTRNRGHGSATHQPANLNLSIPNDWDWKGRTSLDLNAFQTYLQLLGSALCRKGDLAAPESRQVQLRVNAVDPTTVISGTNTGAGSNFGQSYGFYVCNEAKDSAFADHHFPLDGSGNIYSARRVDIAPFTEADLGYHAPSGGQTPADPYRTTYFKETNSAEDDWSDLIAATAALAKGHSVSSTNITWDADYVSAVQATIDVDQFMRWFAVEAFFNNGETNLSRGVGDDYYLYFGATDPRARLVPHDLDTILGDGDTIPPSNDSIFRMAALLGDGVTPTPLNAFMKHPQFAPIYYRELQALMDGPFSAANFNALADGILGGLVSQTVIDARKTAFAARFTYIQSQIPLSISGVTTGLTVSNGYPRTTISTCQLTGQANAINTRSVKVNGVAATWTAWTATWTLPSVALTPGINRVLIQAFDGADAEIQRTYFDIWYDDGNVSNVAGAIGSQTWTAASGPYNVTANLTVNNGATLTIQPGTTVYLAAGATLTVAAGGRLQAIGTQNQPIRFTSAPAAARAIWGGIIINGTLPLPAASQISYAFIEYNANAVASHVAIEAQNNANVIFDHLEFGATDWGYMSLDSASFLVSDCIFPTATKAFELVHGTLGIPSGGRGIIRDCFFGTTNGYNDVVDFTGGNRPGPNIQFINNLFIGSTDDILDLDGTDAWVEGNIFLHCHRNGSPDSASAVSGGGDSGTNSEVTIVGNLFYDVDHAATAKEGDYFTLLSNTVVNQNHAGSQDTATAVVNLGEVDGAVILGAGMYLEGNVIYNAEALAAHFTANTVTFNNNILPMAWAGPGSGNTVVDPLLNDVSNVPTPTKDNFRTVIPQIRQMFGLRPASPARGTGPNGSDKGGIRSLGVSLSGAPTGTTNQTSATITVGKKMTGSGIPSGAAAFPNGSGWTHYQRRVDGGAWSAETAITTPITLSGLANGDHYVEVIGKNDTGYYQNSADYGTSGVIARTATWTVNTSYVPPPAQAAVRINEVLANNTQTLSFSGVFPDAIELTNTGTVSADLSGWGLTDNTALPYKYTITNGTTLAPGAFLTIHASNDPSVPQPRTGFGLKSSGDTLTLTKSVASGGGVADSVSFGNQLPDLTSARALDGSWSLGVPTLGAANQLTSLGTSSSVKINEWLADGVTLAGDDFIELYNPSSKPVDLGGCYLTDNPAGFPDKNLFRPLTFIGAGGYLSFDADANSSSGPSHLNFKLSPLQGEIGLLSPALAVIDSIIYGPQSTDISQGRTPNGSATLTFFNQLSPGAPNPILSTGGVQSLNLIPVNQVWKYFANTAAPSNDASSRAFTHPLYNDSGWASGGGVLHIEPDTLPVNGDGFAKTTLLPPGTAPYQTYYFRTHFNFPGPVSGTNLTAKIMCDDGCVLYLNGTEILPTTGSRIRVAAGAVTYSNLSSAAAQETMIETYNFTSSQLLVGDNVLTVSVHQVNVGGNSDVTWGMKLDATVPTGSPVVLNEVFSVNASYANPDTSHHGWIELYNPSGSAVSLTDYSLSDQAGTPRKFVFGAGVNILASGHVVIQCNPLAVASATNTGFGLPSSGSRLYLFRPLAQGGTLSDSISLGRQIPDFAVGRISNGTGPWTLTTPTRGAINSSAAVAATSNLRINEWGANAGPSWFELYNNAVQPVALSGNYFTDDLTNKTKHLIPPLTYIGGAGTERWQVWTADSDGSGQAGHVSFTLNAAGEAVGLYSASGTQLDAVGFAAQNPGQTGGRFSDGTATILTVMPPTPGAANTQPATDTDADGIPNAWETANGLNTGANDASLDPDKDGFTNLQEYMAGTDPQQPGSRLVATVTSSVTPGQFTINFTAVAGKTYSVRYKDTVTDPAWSALVHLPAAGSTSAVTFNDTPPVGSGKRFYQVVTPSQP